MTRLKPLVITAALATLAGCGPATREYSVVVRNESRDPVTVVLTKDGPPIEPLWLPPEDFAAMRKAPPDWRVNGVVVPAGKTADQKQTGKFSAGTNAVLRVYHGQQTFESLLGFGPTSPNRTDLPLAPGENKITIGRDGKAVRQ